MAIAKKIGIVSLTSVMLAYNSKRIMNIIPGQIMIKKTIQLYLILSVSILVIMGITLPCMAAQENDWYASGLSQHNQGNIEAAIESYTKALAIAPDNPEIFLNRGLARLKTSDYPGAIKDTTRAIELDPSNSRAFDARGMALYFAGDCPGAVQAFTQALDLTPGSADTYVNRGAALFDQQKINPAIEDYTRALTIVPGHINALRNRSLAWFEKHQWEKAVSDSSRALSLSRAANLDCEDIFLSRGLARYGKKDYSGAMDDFQTALSLAPDSSVACNQMAWMLSVCPDPEFRSGQRAVTIARKAIALAPGPDSLDTLALAYAEAGDYEKAIAHQTRLIELADQGRFPLSRGAKKKLATFQAGLPWRVTSLAGEETVLAGKHAVSHHPPSTTPIVMEDKTGGYILVIAPNQGDTLLAESSAATSTPLEIIVSVGRIRSAPSLKAPVIKRLKQGQRVIILETAKDWYRVALDATHTGWGHKSIFSPAPT